MHFDSEASTIHAQFDDHLDITVEDVHERLATLVEEYSLPLDEATRSVRNHYQREAGLDDEAIYDGDPTNDLIGVGDIDVDEHWCDVEVQVVDLWEPTHEAIGQVGLVGDETGTIKFTTWAKSLGSAVPELEEGASYRLRNVVTDEYQGQYSVKLNSATEVQCLDDPVAVGDDEATLSGVLVSLRSPSGLIERCPKADCTRVLGEGQCGEHGDVDGEFDLRLKAVIDDGQSTQKVIVGRAATERLTGMTLEDAIDLATDALDPGAVAEAMRADLLGRYYTVQGSVRGEYLLADSIEQSTGESDPAAILAAATEVIQA